MTMLINPYRYASSGGGGVDDPSTIAGLTLWLDASTLSGFSDGDSVSTWPDQSGNGYDATNGGSGIPVYRPSAVGGQPALEFAASVYAVAPSLAASDMTWFVVMNSNDAAGDLRYIYDASSGRFILSQLGDNAADDAPGYYDGSWRVSGTTAVLGDQVLEYNLSGSGGGFIYRDNTQILSAAYTQKALGGTQRIGRHNSSAQAYFNGHIAEIILYNSALGSTDRATIYTYLNDKYGFAL